MKEITISYVSERPDNFTGKVNYINNNTTYYIVFYLDGEIHCTDGPAFYSKYLGYIFYLYGREYNKEEWLENLSTEDKLSALFNIDEWSSV